MFDQDQFQSFPQAKSKRLNLLPQNPEEPSRGKRSQTGPFSFLAASSLTERNRFAANGKNSSSTSPAYCL